MALGLHLFFLGTWRLGSFPLSHRWSACIVAKSSYRSREAVNTGGVLRSVMLIGGDLAAGVCNCKAPGELCVRAYEQR
ncbi:uncharacterized protein P884DRAFT_261089 [Thermothelomyces heterothallicus CBS 202.75]|uniref:uncharacterized protein n=1 Tax=Thermothelomyces heterothallicus CBS 202.75 TaxID=1149848 RepID=UPI003743D3FD